MAAEFLPLLLLFFLLSAISPFSSASDGTTFVYAGCTQPKYDPGSSYEYNIDSLLSSLANAAGFTSYTNFTSAAAATPYAPAYGLFQCRGDLSVSDCNSCVQSSLSHLSTLCPSTTGAAIHLDGCFLRYGKDNFIGRSDTSLLYKNCGPAPANNGGSSYNPNLAGMRDAALAAMQGSAPQDGTYRAGAAGNVQAITQCVGDLVAKQCADCVSKAVAQLRDACGLAYSGNLYLGKCYARYWTNGIYNSHKKNGLAWKTTFDPTTDVSVTTKIETGLIAAGSAGVIILVLVLARFFWYRCYHKEPTVGLTTEQVGRFPTMSYSLDMQMEDNECSFCLDEFEEGDSIRRLPCSHNFHTEEIDRWLETQITCPLCQRNLRNHIE